jgi:hypothetical protein
LATANELSKPSVEINGTSYSLLALGFTPTFYAFTEATIEAKLEFSLAESEDFSIGAEVGVNVGVVAVSVSASYARKFEMSSSGSSSIAARLVSLPAPEKYLEVLKQLTESTPVPVTKITVSGDDSLTVPTVNVTRQYTVVVAPTNATDKAVTWSLDPVVAGITINTSGTVTIAANTPATTFKVKATSVAAPTVFGELPVAITT